MLVVATWWAALALQGSKPDELVPGLVGEYYSIGHRIEDFYDVLVLPEVRVKRVDPKIDYGQMAGDFAGAPFYARWSGLVRVPRDGRYRFFTNSDDGSRLWIGGTRVVSNGGCHEKMIEQSGEIELKAGDHEIKVDLFSNGPPSGCIVSWQGPGLARQVVPGTALFHRRDREPEKKEPVPEPVAADSPLAVDSAVVTKDEKQPDLVGRVTSVFPDGPVTLVNLRVPGRSGDASVFIRATTKVAYPGLPEGKRKPAPGLVACVWLVENSKDAAAEVRFAAEKK